MPRRAKGARLWLRPDERGPDGKVARPSTWIIRDGEHFVRTGCAREDTVGAETALKDYLDKKHSPARRERALDQIPVADVLNIYAADCAPPEPEAIARFSGRLRRLGAFFTGTLADVSPAGCRAYTASRGHSGGSRRDLEDLRSAINHHAAEGFHRGAVVVALPEKGDARDRWLTRDEAARLLWVCWRTRETQRHSGGLVVTVKYPLRHLARFILLGLYTGTRATGILKASFFSGPDRSFIDIARGLFYRQPEGARLTNKRQPPAPLPPRLLAHLRRWRDKGICAQYAIEWHGVPIKSVKVGFASAVRKAELDGTVSPHTLRHTAATWMMQAGAPKWEAAGYLGMSEAVLDRVYGHHHPDFLGGAVRAVGRKPT